MDGLRQCPVIFDKERHTYTYEGRQLSGITSMLSRQLFADKYNGVSEEVLRQAAERGSRIHSMCELADRMGIDDTPEAKAYLDMSTTSGLVNVDSEYLVSDLEHYASSIDKVYKGYGDNEYWLGDIKTTYHLDKNYLSWQLSVYAYLFERQNPGMKATRLMGIWIRDGHCTLCDIERKPDATIKELLRADAAGERFAPPPAEVDSVPLPEKYKAIEDTLINMQLQYDTLKGQLEKFKAECLSLMAKGNIKKFISDRLTITRRADSVRETFDAKTFKAEHPDLYRQYTKTATAKGGVTLKIL